MKKIQFLLFFSIVSFFSVFSFVAQAQPYERIKEELAVNYGQNSSTAFKLTQLNLNLNKRIAKGDLFLTFSLEEYYKFSTAYSLNVQVALEGFKGGKSTGVLDNAVTLTITNNSPEAAYFLDLRPYVKKGVNNNEELVFDEIRATIVAAPDLSGQTQAFINNIKLTLMYEAFVGVDVSALVPLEPVSNSFSLAVDKKLLSIRWQDNFPLSNYQLQMVRLYNTSTATAATEEQITTKVDWSQAVTMDIVAVPNPATGQRETSLTIAEGTGFYAFRIRPVGSFYEGGIANNKNWGAWSTSHSGEISLAKTTLSLPYFYYTDPDDSRNWIYNRVFTEEGRIKENLTFANSLQQVRQTQTYLPSNNVTIITQTVMDKSGRPALVSIPVPVDGRKNTYQEGFMKTEGGELYQAKHFDEDGTYTPLKVDETGPFSYYKDSKEGVANAEGYPFARTMFYNEGTGRVREQSGVGKTHMMGSQTLGMGRTTHYSYGVASKDEMIALFGDEAPNYESVIKTVTVDPNNIATVTYTSKEGNVIATSLSFTDQEESNLLELDQTSQLAITTTDEIKKNVKVGGQFISSKRINILQPTDMSIGYSIKCSQVERLCETVTQDCNYVLNITLYKLDGAGNKGEPINIVTNKRLAAADCQKASGSQESFQTLAAVVVPLLPGNYLVEKRLTPGTPQLAVKENREAVEVQMRPLANQIGAWLDRIETAGDLEDYYVRLEELEKAFKRINGASLASLQAAFYTGKFTLDLKEAYITMVDSSPLNTYQFALGRINGRPASLFFKTPCCGGIEIPIQYLPTLDCTTEIATDKNANGVLDVVPVSFESSTTQEYFPDFEGYAITFLSGCMPEAEVKNKLYNSFYMKGWEKPGTFNLMVYHMLNDQYNADNTASGPGEVKVQYTCDDLVNCWTALLVRVKEEQCGGLVLEFEDESINVSNSYDEKQKDDPESPQHNDHFDDNFKVDGGFFLTRWIAKRKISRRMRDLQTDEPEKPADIKPVPPSFNLVHEFLGCTGYQFAKILGPLDAQPLAEDRAPVEDFVYTEPNTNNVESPAPVKLRYATKEAYFGTGTSLAAKDYKYIPLAGWGVYDPVGGRNLFPNIKNPIYAFKYFQYTGMGDPDYEALESGVCYTDPNNCYAMENGFIKLGPDGKPILVPCCAATGNSPASDSFCYPDPEYPGLSKMTIGVDPGVEELNGKKVKYIVKEFCGMGQVKCPYTAEKWGAGQRAMFYEMLKNYVRPQDAEWKTLKEIDCQYISTPDTWYTQAGTNTPESMVKSYERVAGQAYTQVKITVNGQEKATFSYLDFQVLQEINSCKSNCEYKRAQLREEVIRMLKSKCYQIGGCRTAETPHIVPEEDIEVMVDRLVEECKQQCTLTTFTCENVACRNFNTPKSEAPGANVLNNPAMALGVGGYPQSPDFCEGQPTTTFDDNNATYVAEEYTSSLDMDGDGAPDKLKRYYYNGNYSYYEHTKMDQVKNWDFYMDIKTMCKDAQGNPIEPDPACCGTVPANTSKGDTFVERKQYEYDRNLPVDVNASKPGTPVKSPVKGVNVKVEK